MDYAFLEGDALEKLKSIPDGSAGLVVSSPPYNIGKSYERVAPLSVYLDYQREVLREAWRVLSPSGSLCWQVGNHVRDGAVYPLDCLLFPVLIDLGFIPRNRVIWHFRHGLHASKRFSGRYETVSWFTKSERYTFNLDSVRVPSLYPNKRHYKGDRKGELSGNPLGKNPSDVWEIIANEWETGLLDIPNVKHNHPEKTNHPCQFPIELVERFVLALTDKGDTVIDPFVGVGSTVIAAVKHGRIGIGIDRAGEYISEAEGRVRLLKGGKLKMREIGTPVYSAKGQ